MRHMHHTILCNRLGDGGRRAGQFVYFVHCGHGVVAGQGMRVEGATFVRVGSV